MRAAGYLPPATAANTAPNEEAPDAPSDLPLTELADVSCFHSDAAAWPILSIEPITLLAARIGIIMNSICR